ncbi:MAG: helix-turn-helix domain-containing protein [Moorellaceae bacterium]
MRLLTLKDLENLTGIKARTWRFYIQTKHLEALRGPRNRLLVTEDELRRFISNLPKAR